MLPEIKCKHTESEQCGTASIFPVKKLQVGRSAVVAEGASLTRTARRSELDVIYADLVDNTRSATACVSR